MDPIPSNWAQHIPGDDVPIQVLLKWSPPEQCFTEYKNQGEISKLFSKELPKGYKDTLGEPGMVPHRTYLIALSQAKKEMEEQGYCSIKGGFPGTNKNTRYPLWVSLYWEKLDSAATSRAAWAKSMAWLKEMGEENTINKWISFLPWTKPTAVRLAFSMDDLAVLLSGEWLGSRHIDFFASHFQQVANEAAMPFLITSLSFSESMGGRSQVSI